MLTLFRRGIRAAEWGCDDFGGTLADVVELAVADAPIMGRHAEVKLLAGKRRLPTLFGALLGGDVPN